MTRHRFHGDPARFDAVADCIADRFGRDVRYIADVAGGQGMLSRVLRKRYGYEAEVVDPRRWTLRGVPSRDGLFAPEDASFYDLVVGLHPDEAIRAVAAAALVRPVVLVPCCNFWDRSTRLGRDALLDAIGEWYTANGVPFDRVELEFSGPMNIALVSYDPSR